MHPSVTPCALRGPKSHMIQTQSSRSTIRLITRHTTVAGPRATSSRFFAPRAPQYKSLRSRIPVSCPILTRGFSSPSPPRFANLIPTRDPGMSVPNDTMSAKSKEVNTTDRLEALRTLMRKGGNDIQAYIIPSEDQHSSEYLAECDQRRSFISGFNGSAGCAIITLDRAYMFTDGRYFLQAAEQMDSNWTLMKQGLPDVPTWQDFLHKELPPNSRIGIDPTLIAASDAQSISSSLAANSSSTLVPLADNLVDQVWADRPTRPKTKVRALAVEFAGQSSQEKVEAVRAELKKEKADAIVVTMLDEVAWLFNLRGSDINFNPVFFAYAVITTTTSTLYIDPVQLSVVSSQPNSSASSASGKSSSFTTVISSDHLPLDLKIKPYTDIWTDLSTLGSNSTKVLVGSKASMKVLESINGDSAAGDSTASSSAAHIVSMISPTPASSTQGKSGDAAKAVGILVRSPIADLKTIKNETEIYGFRACHVRDGVALARYFAWLEEVLEKGEEVSEWNAAEVLEKYRSENELFRGLSFDTISSTGPNAAIIHYSPDPKDCAIIKQDQMYLCDSGGQYLDGTTDVTRTWHFGKPSEEERRAFTRVLQGHIAIDTAVFPQGTTGYQIDTWARRPLWQDGLDYRHGTGHGVGHFLNVHEGPQGIGMRITYNDTALKKGMTVSNEPGYYADGRFGIRIESIVIVREVSTPYNFGDKGSYLGFEHVTVSPIHTKLVNVSLMSPAEVEWLNEYHKEVWEKVSPGLKAVGDERAERWLERECKPIGLDAAR